MFGAAMAAAGVASLATIAALHASEFYVLPVYSLLGGTGGLGLALGFCVLFYEWKDHR
jgi:hypothetical protein